MKKSKWLLKLAAVVSWVLLMGGFVCYRAGAFNRLRETEAPPADAGGSPALEPGPVDPVTAANDQAGSSVVEPVLFYSSKSGTIVPLPVPGQQAPAGTTQPPSTIISGSKSIILAIPPPATPQPAPPASPPPPKP